MLTNLVIVSNRIRLLRSMSLFHFIMCTAYTLLHFELKPICIIRHHKKFLVSHRLTHLKIDTEK